MKITKSRLKQIVEEETKKILAEQPPPGVSPSTYAKDKARARRVSPPKMSKAERDKLVARHQAAKDKKDDEVLAKGVEDRANRARGERLKKSMAGARGDSGHGAGVQSLYDEPGGPSQFKGRSLAPGGGMDIEASLQQGAAEAEGVAGAGDPSGTDAVTRRAYGMLDDAPKLGKDIPDYMRRAPMLAGGLPDPEFDPPADFYDTGAAADAKNAAELADARAAGAALGRKKKSRSRVASGGKLTGRKLNRMRDRGEIDQATWLKARRALANRGQEAARLALGPGTGSTGTTDLATGRSKGRGDQDAYNDAMDQAGADAAAPQVADAAAADMPDPDPDAVPPSAEMPDPGVKDLASASDMRDPGEEDPFNSLSLLKQARAEVLRGDAPSNIKFKRSLNRTYKKRVKELQGQGASLADAKSEAADSALELMSKKLRNRIARVEAFPETQRMQAKRSRGAAKSRLAAKQLGGGGRDLASVRDQPRGDRATASGRAPGGTLEESKYLQIVREELQNVLSENVAQDPEVIALIKKVAATGFATVPQLEKTVAGRDKKTVTNWLTSKLTKKVAKKPAKKKVAKKDPAVELQKWKDRCKGKEKSDICKTQIAKWTKAVADTQYAAAGPPGGQQ